MPRPAGQDPAGRRPPPSLLRDPARALVVVGSVIAILFSALPWLTKVGNPPPETVTGWSGLFDGFLIATAAVALIGIVRSRDAADATTWIVRWLPTILGLLMVLFGLSAIRDMDNQVLRWSRENATGVRQPALWACLAGVAIVNTGTVVLGVRQWRAARRSGAPILPPMPSRRSITWVLSGTLGGLAGVGVALLMVTSLDLPAPALGLALLVGVFVGGLVGARLGIGFARSPSPELDQTDGRPSPPARDTGLDRSTRVMHKVTRERKPPPGRF